MTIRPGDIIPGDGGTTFVATERWIAHQSRCPHIQAEPVTLSTGEHVACICIGCLGQLPVSWIQRQYDLALRVAYCTHEYEVGITGFGQADTTLTCTRCGRTRVE